VAKMPNSTPFTQAIDRLRRSQDVIAGQLAYESFMRSVNKPAKWATLPTKIQDAWIAAAVSAMRLTEVYR
jgi:hypothetical protein